MKFKYIFLLLSILSVLTAEERPRTFSEAQEAILAKNPKTLSFLFHMTRSRLNFEEMAERFSLDSISNYKIFLVKNKLIKELGDGKFEYLFLNPHGTWALRTHDGSEDAIYYQLREKGLERLSKIIQREQVNLDDVDSAKWTTNTAWLTPEEFREYKNEISNICKKYTDLSEFNLFHDTENRQAVWMMHLGAKIPEETAKTSHLLFGSVEEFDAK